MGYFKLRWSYPAADGEVSITVLFGAAFKEFTPNLFHWIWEEGGCDEATRDKPWADLIVRLIDRRESATEIDRLADVIAAFTAAHQGRARRRGPPPAGAAGPGRHARRGARQRPPRRPGLLGPRPGRLGRTGLPPPRPLRRRHRHAAAAPSARRPTSAPTARPVLAEPGGRPAPRAAGRGGQPTAPGPLAGLKVIDLTWSVAGPSSAGPSPTSAPPWCGWRRSRAST